MDSGYARLEADERFNAVDAALLEQRQYTEFAFSRLDAKMDSGYARLDAKMDSGYARLDAKMDSGYARLEARVDSGDAQLKAQMDSGFSRIERKLDQFIDVQLQTNELVDRRLRAVEEGRAPDA